MPTITDWLMVAITIVYVVATIAIFVTNKKSEKAAYAQLDESKRQYEDKKRLEIMPYIQFEETNSKTNLGYYFVLDGGDKLQGQYVLSLRMKNIGNGTAKDISFIYKWDNFSKSHDHGAFIIQALSSGESQLFKADFAYSTNLKESRSVCFVFKYRDLLNNAYSQRLDIKFDCANNLTLRLTDLITSSPLLLTEENNNA